MATTTKSTLDQALDEALDTPFPEAPEGSADRIREAAGRFVTDYDARGEAVDVPVTPVVTPVLPGMEDAMVPVTLWSDFEGIAVNGVEVSIGGRLELSLSQSDMQLAERLVLRKRLVLPLVVEVKAKTHKILEKKGSFDGMVGIAVLKVVGYAPAMGEGPIVLNGEAFEDETEGDE